MRWLLFSAAALFVISLPCASAAGLRAASNSYAHLRVAAGRAGIRGGSGDTQASESPAKAEEEEEAAEDVETGAEDARQVSSALAVGEHTMETEDPRTQQAHASPTDNGVKFSAREEATKTSGEKDDPEADDSKADEAKADDASADTAEEPKDAAVAEADAAKADAARDSLANNEARSKAQAPAHEEAAETTPAPAPEPVLPDSIPADFFSNEEYTTCSPPCIEGRGVCNDNTCFCKSPYRGSTCQKTVKDESIRIAYSVLAGIVAISMFVGCTAANVLFAYLTFKDEKKVSYLGEAKARQEEWSPEAAKKKKSKT